MDASRRTKPWSKTLSSSRRSPGLISDCSSRGSGCGSTGGTGPGSVDMPPDYRGPATVPRVRAM
jgi:hypothetical protein